MITYMLADFAVRVQSAAKVVGEAVAERKAP